jgi:serine/threonine-protein kinase
VDEASLIGTTLDDRYRLLEMIGDGGMGRVFRAEQLATGRTVALKLLHSELCGLTDVVQRFEREAELTARLSHPHIVKTVEYGNWDGRLYLAMEFVSGQSLAHLLDSDVEKNGGRLTVKRTIAIMRPVLHALEYAHGLGVVHRDLKPDNIMLVPPRGLFSREWVKLLDFGVAKLGSDGQTQGRKLTQIGMVLGTPGYMSPEQATGQTADARSDLYSCGVVLYEMLAGRRPFRGTSGLEVLGMQMSAPPASLREIAGDASIPSQIEDVVMRALAKRPDQRFQSARELRESLDRAAVGREANVVVSGIETTIFAAPLKAPPRRGWMHSAIIAAAMALLIAWHLGPEAVPKGKRASSVAKSDSGDGARQPAEGDESQLSGEAAGQPKIASAKRSPKLKKSRPKAPQTAPKRHPARP